MLRTHLAFGDQRRLHFNQRIAWRYAVDGAERAAAVVAGADEHCVGQGGELVFHLVERAIEEVFQCTGHVTEILRRAE